MRDIWYADKRDLVKWSVLHYLAEENEIRQILQVAYFRESTYGQVKIDDQELGLPSAVLSHFRDIRQIKNLGGRAQIQVLTDLFSDRKSYMKKVISFISQYKNEKCIVFLDPDTGLEPLNAANLNHVLDDEAKAIWEEMKQGDLLVLYQHQTNRRGQPWKEEKRQQFISALGVPNHAVKIAEAENVANDVVFYYSEKEQ